MQSEITLDKAKELLTKECLDVLKWPGVEEALHVLAEETARLGNELPEKILGEFSYYEGQLNGLHIALCLINRLPKAKKLPWICEAADHPYTRYKCECCRNDEVDIEDNYCSRCGALFVEEENELLDQ